MKPVVLLVGKLPGIVGHLADELEDMPIRWLGAHNREEVIEQLDSEPEIVCAVMDARLDDHVRGELMGVIAARRPDISIHLKDRASGPEATADFVRRVVSGVVLNGQPY